MTPSHKQMYQYSARDLLGKKVRGTVLASNAQEVYQHVLHQKCFLISARPQASTFKTFLSKKTKIPAQDLMDFCLHMHFMDQAGVPLLDALQDAQENSNLLRPYLQQIILEIKSGKLFSEALKEQGDVFPPLFTHILHLSEQTGKLHEGFKKIYDHLLWTSENKRLLVKSVQYPLLVLTLLCICIWMMSTVVIPQMQDLITMSGAKLPTSTRWLLNINSALTHGIPKFILILCAAFLVLLGLRILSDLQKTAQDRWLLKIPILGPLMHNQNISLYLHYFHVCIGSHMDLIEALDHSKKIVRNQWILQKLDACTQSVTDGQTLSVAFKQSQVFNPSCIRLIQVGELTGRLLPLLALLEAYAQRDLKKRTEQFIQYLQPVLLGIVGFMFIWIILGVFYPIYDQLLLMED